MSEVLRVLFGVAGFFKIFDGSTHTMCCLSGMLMLPHYFNDFLCYQSNIVVLLCKQAEAKLIVFYNTAFCILLSILVQDDRTYLIWGPLFLGINLVTFSDACAFQAETTKKTLELALVCFAMPFLLILDLGLRRNLATGWQVSWFPRLPIEVSDVNTCFWDCEGEQQSGKLQQRCR